MNPSSRRPEIRVATHHGKNSGVPLDVGDQIEKLFGSVRQQTLFGMPGHGRNYLAAASFSSRAARSFSKSLSA